MNKAELIEKVSGSVKEGDIVSKAAAERIVTAVFDAIRDEVVAGNDVTLVGFGTFKSVKRAEKAGRNPATGEAMTIPATVAPKFVAGSAFKKAVAKK